MKSRITTTDILCSHGFIFIFALVDEYSKFIKNTIKEDIKLMRKEEIKQFLNLNMILNDNKENFINMKKHTEKEKEITPEVEKFYSDLEYVKNYIMKNEKDLSLLLKEKFFEDYIINIENCYLKKSKERNKGL